MINRSAEPAQAHPPARELPDVGMYIDDQRAIAAVSRAARSSPSLHVASLHDTVLYVHSDGSASLGRTDDLDAAEFTGFVDAIGEEASSDHAPGDLVAMALRCLLADVAQSIGTPVDTLAAAATFPARWTAEQVSAVRMAMSRVGLDHVALVSESEARAAWAGGLDVRWAGSDSGIAAARGAAMLAAEFPIEAVTEEIPLRTPVRPLWTRTPILAAAAFAALLTLGAGLTALLIQDTSGPSIPEIESAQGAEVTVPIVRPSSQIPFPTAVPFVEPSTAQIVAPAPAPAPTTTPPEVPRTSDVVITPATTQPAPETSVETEPETTTPKPVEPDVDQPEVIDPSPEKPTEPTDPEPPKEPGGTTPDNQQDNTVLKPTP